MTPFTKNQFFCAFPLPIATLPEQNVILFSSKANTEQMGLKNGEDHYCIGCLGQTT